jgi:hypothetical protein
MTRAWMTMGLLRVDPGPRKHISRPCCEEVARKGHCDADDCKRKKKNSTLVSRLLERERGQKRKERGKQRQWTYPSCCDPRVAWLWIPSLGPRIAQYDLSILKRSSCHPEKTPRITHNPYAHGTPCGTETSGAVLPLPTTEGFYRESPKQRAFRRG